MRSARTSATTSSASSRARTFASSRARARHRGARRPRSAVADRAFDLILGYYVVEHLRDPVGELGEWRELLDPGGRVAIEVPNVDDALVRYWSVEAFDRFYWQKAHYFNYSHETLDDGAEDGRLRRGARRFRCSATTSQTTSTGCGRASRVGWARTPICSTSGVNAEYARALRERWLCDTVMAVAYAAVTSTDERSTDCPAGEPVGPRGSRLSCT